jgi:hypothetical protein
MGIKDELKALKERKEQLKEQEKQLKDQQIKTSVEELADLADKFKDANETVNSLRDIIIKKMDEIKEEERADDEDDDEDSYEEDEEVDYDEMDNGDFLSEVEDFINTRALDKERPTATKPVASALGEIFSSFKAGKPHS